MENKSIIPSFILLICLVVIPPLVMNKKQIPVIRANSIAVDLRDGEVLKKSAWQIVPSAKPDVYITHNKNSKVTFYTDLDSISLLVRPHEKYQFIILLNGKDSVLTEVFYVPEFMPEH